ncbi:MAG TPA: type VI secretion system baseplate subunit TssF [Gemmatimonadota bacterium]|nr:type VI secretion system baseplate subunit TssF [Gemmatimonadota bacterium]
MRDDLLYYYERELAFLRRMGAEFAEKYPKIASRLLLEPNKCDDPHVERILEGFAFLAARVHLKLDDDFSEVSEALLSIIYPHYVRPIPSMSLVEFQLDPDQGKLTSGLHVAAGSELYSRPVGGDRCKFRTCYDTTVWPLRVSAANWRTPDQLAPPVKAADALAALRLELECLPDVMFANLELDTLRLYLNGEPGLVSTLYELLLNSCTRILVRDPARPKRPPLEFPASVLTPVGFAEDEGMLPYPRRSFSGYRLLQEYFTFPQKYLFLDLSVFDAVRQEEFSSRVEVVFLIAPFERGDRREILEAGVHARVFRQGCTPIINLFEQESDPVLLTQRSYDTPVIADARRRKTTCVFSINEVLGVAPSSEAQPRFQPFYSYRHGSNGGRDQVFWYAKRARGGLRGEEGSDVYLSFADLSGQSVQPDLDCVTCKLTCYNGELPSRLPFGDESGDWVMQGGGPIEKVLTLVKPTAAIQPPLGKAQLWRLISQLSLNYLSLVEGGTDALRELLRLYNFGDSAAAEKQIQGIAGVSSSPCYSRIESAHGLTFARGHRVEIEFDEEHFTGGGVFLFASVLERFLGLYASLNSFSILAVRSRQRKELLREWPPRAGWKALL